MCYSSRDYLRKFCQYFGFNMLRGILILECNILKLLINIQLVQKCLEFNQRLELICLFILINKELNFKFENLNVFDFMT